jgi:leader peptidase (prepilin peptidase) / N-methyltransferase
VALVFAALAAATLDVDHAVVATFAATVLVLLAAIDLEQGVIPNRIVLPATAVVLVAQLALFPGRAGECVLAAFLAGLALMTPQLLRRDWLGVGDAKMAMLMGATLGWGVLAAAFLAFLCVFPVALVMLIRHGGAARKSTIPFGPFLALGALIVLFGPHLAGLPAG